MYRYLILYRKNNGDIIYRARTSKPMHQRGEYTSMGWQVLDIRRLHKGKSMSYTEYDELLEKKKTINNILVKISSKNLIEFFKIVLLLVGFVYICVKFNK